MVKSFFIGSHNLGAGPCYIIAEIGSNHDGDKSKAFEMIRLSAQAGADAVKFQFFKADKIAANIDIPETHLKGKFAKFGKNVYDLYKNMELPDSWLKELKACCDENGVDFLATPFDEESADKLADIGVPAIKIASFEITHIPLLKHVSKLKLPILLSTGMAELDEIKAAIEVINKGGEERVALFHCGIEYPVPFESVHLRCMDTLRNVFQCPVGYSDHSQGYVVAIAAVARGVQLYEKHVTMDSGISPDHHFALNLRDFTEMVKLMRESEKTLGSDKKKVRENEKEDYIRGRRSIFVVKDVLKGEVFSESNLAVLRPGIGLPPKMYEEILGKKASSDIKSTAVLRNGDWEQ